MTTESRTGPSATLGFASVVALIVGNMVGTGVFTSLGYQVAGTETGFALLALWALGGLLSLMGALCYAELGAMLPRSGGEYVYLARAWSPALGFTGGFVSVTAGFAAPIAIAAMAFGKYAAVVVPIPASVAALGVIAIVALVHLSHADGARLFQLTTSTLTISVIVLFVVAGFAIGPVEPIRFAPTAPAWGELFEPGFAISLIYVVYAYLGWNAVGYVAGEVRDPQRVIPRAVVSGVVIVAVLYLLLHLVFLRTTPIAALSGQVEVAALSAQRIFGDVGGRLMSAMIATILVATVSALLLAGSRVTQAVAGDTSLLRSIGVRGRDGVPRRAIALQVLLAIVLILTATFEQVVTYAGIVLNLCNVLAVLGLMRLRRTEPALPRPFRVPFYPWVPLGFAAMSAWMIVFSVQQRPIVLLSAILTLGLGIVLHRVVGRSA